MASKQSLVDRVALKSFVSKEEAAKRVDSVLDAIKHVTVNDGELQLVGFATFTKVHKPATTARNPRTGATVQTAAKDVIKVKASPSFLK